MPAVDAPVFDLARHRDFTPVEDPVSGITRYVLTGQVAQLQKAFYFVTPCIGTGSRWMWFHACDPPSRRWQLAVVSLDPDEPEIRRLPGAMVNGNPLVIGDGSEILVPVEEGVYRMGVDGRVEELFRIPPAWVKGRHLFSLVTEITMSADGRLLLMDSQVGNRSLIWIWDLQAKEARLLHSMDKKHHHTIFSPTDPGLFMISQAPGMDPISGEKINMDIRIWLMDVDQTRFEPLQADQWFGRNSLGCHEWWTPEGKVQWCDYNDGIYEVAVHGEDRRRRMVWPRRLIHGQVDRTGRWLCGDWHPYKWNEKEPCRVWLFDRQESREAQVAGPLPRPTWVQDRDNRALHLDPHPHFSANGDYLVHTTSDLGRLSVSVVPTAQFTGDDSPVRFEPVAVPASCSEPGTNP